MSPETHEVLIIGAGLAGMTAAVRGAELGLSVTVLEQGTGNYPCNSRSSGGILHLSYQDPAGSPASLEAGMKAMLGEEIDAGLVADIADRAAAALDWLSAHGARFIKASPVPWHRWTLAPPRPLRPGFDFPGVGADVLLNRLADELKHLGGSIRLGEKAKAARKDEAGFRVTVATEHGDKVVSARTLIIADGGFQGDMAALARNVTARTDRIVQRGAGTGSGFALTAADSLGCRLVGLDRFYGHLLSSKALCNPRLNPYPQIDPVAAAGMVVGPDGRRFADEGRGGVFMANALVRLADPASAFAIVDDAAWKAASQRALYPIASLIEPEDGALMRASTLRELAGLCGIDPQVLEETAAAYNRIVEDAVPGAAPPRSGAASPLAVPPFVAIPLAPGITNTMGGIAVDADARALDPDGVAVKGLYAVGAAAGGLEGGRRVGYVGGLMRAVTSGMAAAEHIAANGKANPVARDLPAPTFSAPALVLPVIVRHAMLFSVTTGLAVVAAISLLGWTVAGPWAIIAGAGAGLLSFVLAKAFTEIAAIILDLLIPG